MEMRGEARRVNKVIKCALCALTGISISTPITSLALSAIKRSSSVGVTTIIIPATIYFGAFCGHCILLYPIAILPRSIKGILRLSSWSIDNEFGANTSIQRLFEPDWPADIVKRRTGQRVTRGRYGVMSSRYKRVAITFTEWGKTHYRVTGACCKRSSVSIAGPFWRIILFHDQNHCEPNLELRYAISTHPVYCSLRSVLSDLVFASIWRKQSFKRRECSCNSYPPTRQRVVNRAWLRDKGEDL